MGNICDCSQAKSQTLPTMAETPMHLKDPRLIDIHTHMKIMEQKVQSNINSIDDFIQLLLETTQEEIMPSFKELAYSVAESLEQAKMHLQELDFKKHEIKRLLEQADFKYHISQKIKKELQEGHDSKDESNELIDNVYKKIQETLKILRKGEEEAQIQMLRWENQVIQQEKMQKLRIQVQTSFNTDNDFFGIAKQSLNELKTSEQHFSQIYNDLQIDGKSSYNNQNIFDNESSGQSIMMKNDPFEEEHIEQEKDVLQKLGCHLSGLKQEVNTFSSSLMSYEQKHRILEQEKNSIDQFDYYDLDTFTMKLDDIKYSKLYLENNITKQQKELKSKFQKVYSSIKLMETLLSEIVKQERWCQKLNIMQSRDSDQGNNEQNEGSLKAQIERQNIKKQAEKYQNIMQQLAEKDLSNVSSEMKRVMQFIYEIYEFFNKSLLFLQEEKLINHQAEHQNLNASDSQQVQEKLIKKMNKYSNKLVALNDKLQVQHEISSEIINKELKLHDEDLNQQKEEIFNLKKRLIALQDFHKSLKLDLVSIQKLLLEDDLFDQIKDAHLKLTEMRFQMVKLSVHVDKNYRLSKRFLINNITLDCYTYLKTIHACLKDEKKIIKSIEKFNRRDTNTTQQQSDASMLSHVNESLIIKQIEKMERDESFIENQQKIVREFKEIVSTLEGEASDMQKAFKKFSRNNKAKLYLSATQYADTISSETKLQKIKDEGVELRQQLKIHSKKLSDIKDNMESLINNQQLRGSPLKNPNDSFMRSNTLMHSLSGSLLLHDLSLSQTINQSMIAPPNNVNRLSLNSLMAEDDQCNNSVITVNMALMDEIDQVLLKCIEEQKIFKSMNISKVRKGVYNVEKKQYQFKVMKGGNLAIRMFAGYVFTDCLIHFNDEITAIVKD